MGREVALEAHAIGQGHLPGYGAGQQVLDKTYLVGAEVYVEVGGQLVG